MIRIIRIVNAVHILTNRAKINDIAKKDVSSVGKSFDASLVIKA